MGHLNYRHLYYFWKVATEENLTRAAKTLHISQSALSSQIKQLEHAMDVQLFERKGRNLYLTEAGTKALSYAQEIFTKGKELEALLREGQSNETQHIRIGVHTTMSRNFIETFIAPLLIDPNVTFSLHTRGLTNLLDGLLKHQLDIVLSNVNINQVTSEIDAEQTNWQSQLLARQPISVIGHPNHRFSFEDQSAFNEVTWVLPAHPSEIRRAFEAFCTLKQIKPRVVAEADDMAMLRLLARDSDSLTVLPSVVVRDEIQSGILVEHMPLENVYEHFYAITTQRLFTPPKIAALLDRSLQSNLMGDAS